MPRKESIKRASADELAAMRARGETRSDWKAAEARSHAEADHLADEDDGALPAGWQSSVEIGIPRKEAVHIRLDADVLAWFRDHGPGYQTRINAVLRSFVQARQQSGPKSR